jgi:tripartite-type tricarboxylate transporter receptor subunit TctC
MIHKRRQTVNFNRLCAGASLAIATGLAAAQGFPSAKPIRLIVGYPPGGGIDFAARTVQVPLQEALKQQLVVDYKPGASEINKALASPELRAKLTATDNVPTGGTAEAFAKEIANEYESNGRIIKSANIKAD